MTSISDCAMSKCGDKDSVTQCSVGSNFSRYHNRNWILVGTQMSAGHVEPGEFVAYITAMGMIFGQSDSSGSMRRFSEVLLPQNRFMRFLIRHLIINADIRKAMRNCQCITASTMSPSNIQTPVITPRLGVIRHPPRGECCARRTIRFW